MELNNGTGNRGLGEHTVAIGQGCLAPFKDQTVLGRYPELPTGDASTDAMVFGGGRSKSERVTAARITEDGEFIAQGGGEVYMISPDTGDLVPVYMLGKNNRYKKVFMSR